MTIAQRLEELGLVLSPPFTPAANYVGCKRVGDVVFLSGHGPVDATRVIMGKVGGNLTLEEGREAARITALSLLATLQAEIGSLDDVVQIVKVLGMVNTAPGFNRTPAVIDGCSDLLV